MKKTNKSIWELFEKTGKIEFYNLYKDIQKDDNGY